MHGRRGVVAAGHALTAGAAGEVLRDGGNAFDAALAALCAACACEPALASFGGGGFLLAVPAGGRPRVYDFFVHTPKRRLPADAVEFEPIFIDFGTARQEFHIGRGTVAVPGMVRGFFDVHRDLCTMRAADLVAPACTLLRDGVEITGLQAHFLHLLRPILAATPESLALYRSGRGDGALLGEGERLRNPDLADLLEVMATEGDDVFYRGAVARALAEDLRAGGLVGLDDLAAYRAEVRAPLALDYRGVQVLTNPPPSAGGALIGFGLGLLNDLPVAAAPPGNGRAVAMLADVMRATRSARAETQDGEPAGSSERMLDPALLARWQNEIRGRAQAVRGTTHLGVIDVRGNLASLTMSNGEGSGRVIPGTGIVLNNMLGEEDINPGGFHRWPPDHRMTSMMAPTALRWPDGREVATGSGGSNRIRSAVLQVIVNLVDHGMELDEAVRAPRIHVEGPLLSVEGGHDADALADALAAWLEHQVWDDRSVFFGGAHTVERRGDALGGAGDPRRDGASLTV